MPPIIHSGEPGTKWVNDTGKVRYQIVCLMAHTCGGCLQYHMAIGGYWPIPLHRGCKCQQFPIGPGGTAPHAFVDFREVLAELPHAKQVDAIGASNYKLLKAKVVTWDEIVTRYRVRPLREVIALNKVSEATALAAGVKPGIAKVAYGAVNTTEAELIRAHRAELEAKLQEAGVSHEALVDALSKGLTGKVTIVGPGGTQSMEPFVASRGGRGHADLLALELARLYPPKPPEPPPAGTADDADSQAAQAADAGRRGKGRTAGRQRDRRGGESGRHAAAGRG